ncbi:hypothetical protein CEXT_804731 [Caerostris extrusa]|uniref:Uncharacterized protein n=1 Tax=Caerostris extrusa TaxID=172846 RepID=A0AAV4XZW9_CAEEX|nr:hypothetical protein CEXT_804731 [Caerostris extrusa]
MTIKAFWGCGDSMRGGKQGQSRKEGSNSCSDMPNPGSRDSIVLWGDGCTQSALRTKGVNGKSVFAHYISYYYRNASIAPMEDLKKSLDSV